jgi:transcriptional regulator with XRE-family HTH domain
LTPIAKRDIILGMKLLDYLKSENLTLTAFAKRIGAGYTTVQQWATGTKLPRKPMMQKIFEATGGAVTPNDFCDLPRRTKGDAA